MPNFPFTSVGCPDAKCCQLVPTLARTLRSYLDSCHQLAVHQPSIRCDRAPTPTHPLPNSNFAPLPTGDGWPNTASFARIPTQAADATSDTVGPSPRWHEPPHHHPATPPGHLLPPEQVPVTLHTSLRSAETLGLTSQRALPPPR